MLANSRVRPLLIYDGDCGFCKRWISLWKEMTGHLVHYAPFQEVEGEFPKIQRSQFEKSVILMTASGEMFKGAEAVFLILAQTPHLHWAKFLISFYKYLPGFAALSEALYSIVAHNRVFFSHLTYFLFGDQLTRSQFFLSRWIFMRVLGLVYLVAFVSLGIQVAGLVGSQGILSSDFSTPWLHTMCIAGAVGSILLMIGVVPVAVLIGLWGLYYTLTQSCQDFLWFQWDGLMLEMGFLAIFFAPLSFLPKSIRNLTKESAPSRVVLFLFYWLLFRVIFFSGWVKLSSGDPSWRNLTALSYHYETQPLPTWVGWYAHQLPMWFQKFSAGMVFVIELGVPFLIFVPRRPRIWAFFILMGFQILIGLTGNYGFFGWQTGALCLLLLDDSFWLKIVPKSWMNASSLKKEEPKFKRGLNYGLAIVVVSVSLFHFQFLSDWIAQYRIINHYGVFAVMTTHRDEIIIEGSRDGQVWIPYEFKWKPGDLKRAPAFVEPHMPRLDWQMWFASLSQIEDTAWVIHLMACLLEGSPSVLGLLERNPFIDSPPQHVRALRYEYHFTDIPTKRKTGDWWTRKFKGIYSPTFTMHPK